MIPTPVQAEWSESGRCWRVYLSPSTPERDRWYVVLPNESTEGEREWVHGEQFDGGGAGSQDPSDEAQQRPLRGSMPSPATDHSDGYRDHSEAETTNND